MILQDLVSHWSTFVQVMASCCQASNHYPSQCWPSDITWSEKLQKIITSQRKLEGDMDSFVVGPVLSDGPVLLTHWGRVTHICISKLTIIGSDNGLSPGRRQAIIWTNAGILLIQILGTNFSEILGKIHSFSFKKMHLEMLSAKGCLFNLDLNELSARASGGRVMAESYICTGLVLDWLTVYLLYNIICVISLYYLYPKIS